METGTRTRDSRNLTTKKYWLQQPTEALQQHQTAKPSCHDLLISSFSRLKKMCHRKRAKIFISKTPHSREFSSGQQLFCSCTANASEWKLKSFLQNFTTWQHSFLPSRPKPLLRIPFSLQLTHCSSIYNHSFLSYNNMKGSKIEPVYLRSTEV